MGKDTLVIIIHMGDIPESAPQYAALLNEILTTLDNDRRRYVENVVIRSLKIPKTCLLLVTVIEELSCGPGIRQLAAVLLRKRILSFWRTLEYNAQQELKLLVLNRLQNETERLVRLAVTSVVCLIAKSELRENHWPEFHSFLQGAAQSQHAEHRELAMVIIYSLAEAIGDTPSLHQTTTQILCQGLRDSDPKVRMSALQSVQIIVPFLSVNAGVQGTKAMLHVLVPATLELVKEYVSSHAQANIVIQAMDVLEQFSEMHMKDYGDYILQIVQFMGATAITRDAHYRVREEACSVLAVVFTNKPRMVVKQHLVPNFINLCLQLLSEDEIISVEVGHEEDEEDMDDDQLDLIQIRPPTHWAGRMLDQLAEVIPAKHIVPLLMEQVIRAQSTPNIPPLEKKGIALAVASSTYGAASLWRRHVGALLAFAKQLLGDQVAVVRAAGAFLISFMCMHLQPDILLHEKVLVPLLGEQLQDSSDEVRCRICQALDSLCDELQEKLDPYINALVPALIGILPQSCLRTQKEVCRALSSIGQAQCPSFQQFGEGLLQMLREPLEQTTPETIPLRSTAMELAGVIAVLIGKQRFAPYFQYFVAKCLAGLKDPRAELRGECFGFVGNLCEMMQREFSQYLPDVVPIIVQTISADVNRYQERHPLAMADLAIAEDQTTSNNAGTQEEGTGGAEDDSDESVHELGSRTRLIELEEKQSAIYTVGVLLYRLRSDMQPYFDSIKDALEETVSYDHQEIKKNTLVALTNLAIAKEGFGYIRVVENPMSERLEEAAREEVDELMVVELLPIIAGEEDRYIVAAAVDCVAKLLEELGAVAVHLHTDKLVEHFDKMLRKESTCQLLDEDDSEDEADEDDGGGHDEVLLDAVCDGIEALASAYGPAFSSYFGKVAESIFSYLDLNGEEDDHTMATGCLAMTILHMREGASPYCERALTIAMALGPQSSNFIVQGNCAMICRSVVESCPNGFNTNISAQVLQFLHGIAVGPFEDTPQVTDNAISAACSLVRQVPQTLNVDAVLPSILRYLPMKFDKEEQLNATRTLVHCCSAMTGVVVNHLQAMLECCGRTFMSEVPSVEGKQELSQALQSFIVSPNHAAVASLLPQLAPHLREALQRVIF